MELRHLRYFVALAEERNYRRAAERLHIAQPPLSRQIQQLEEMLEVALVEKGSRPLRLTEAGAFFLVHARQVLDQVRDLHTMTQRVGKLERRLSVGFVASTLYGELPDIMRRYRELYPQVEVTLHEMTTVEQLAALKEGRIDVGFGRLKSEDPSIRRIVLREEPLVVALPPDHRFSGREERLRLTELAHDTLLVYPKAPRPSFADQVLAIFAQANVTPAMVTEVRELQIAMGLVAAGQGIAIVPESVQAMHHRNVVYRRLADQHVLSPILFSVRNGDRSPELENLLAATYAIYDELGIDYTAERLAE